METNVPLDYPTKTIKLMSVELEALRLEAEFKNEISHLKKEKLYPRPEAIKKLLNNIKTKETI